MVSSRCRIERFLKDFGEVRGDIAYKLFISEAVRQRGEVAALAFKQSAKFVRPVSCGDQKGYFVVHHQRT